MSEWQPIETAPKDGTEIIGAFYRDYGFGTPSSYGPWTIRWDGKEWISSWDGWQVVSSQTDFGTDYREPDIEPTHWMPLPEPPALTARQQEVERLRAASIASGNALYEARARNAELVKALEPFALLADYYQNGASDEPAEAIVPNIGDLRRARAALGGQSNEA